MKHFDIVRFEPDAQFSLRLGYNRVYSIGRDFNLSNKPGGSSIPQIVVSSNQGILTNAIRDLAVAGIIFDGNEPIKKVIEKATELNKTVFLPINLLFTAQLGGRGQALGRLRKTAYACAELGAEARIISLAETIEQMLSSGQMSEIANLILGHGDSSRIFGVLPTRASQ